MRRIVNPLLRLLLAAALVMALSPFAFARKDKPPSGLAEILMHMNEASKNLETVTANLDYTSVTVLVDDKSTQSGQLYFRNAKTPDILIDFQKPERKMLLLKKNIGQIFMPKINQVQEFDLSHKGDLMQQFLLLGFGSDTNELKKIYDIKYLQEVQFGDEATVQLELTPRKPAVAAQITKIQVWIGEDTWLPVQQKFFEPSGDYLIARYSGVKINRKLPNSTFELNAPKDAKRVKMN